ncbi:penicillin-binding transpeptidase domain-containing protein [Actinomycetota bacterium]
MTSAYAAIAAGSPRWTPAAGRRHRPPGRLGPDGGRAAQGRRHRAGGEFTAFLHDALAGVVSDGTARGAFAGFDLKGWPVAGKTSTAEVFGHQDTGWFVSWAPADAPPVCRVGHHRPGRHRRRQHRPRGPDDPRAPAGPTPGSWTRV